MEQSINGFIKSNFNINGRDIKEYSPLTLAYIGDSVFDLVVKTMIVDQTNMPANKLHKKASAIVKASNQAAMMDLMEPYLKEEEVKIFTRGRNAKSPTTAKNASVHDYRIATGFEALIGYLYLTNQDERMLNLIKIGLGFEE